MFMMLRGTRNMFSPSNFILFIRQANNFHANSWRASRNSTNRQIAHTIHPNSLVMTRLSMSNYRRESKDLFHSLNAITNTNARYNMSHVYAILCVFCIFLHIIYAPYLILQLRISREYIHIVSLVITRYVNLAARTRSRTRSSDR